MISIHELTCGELKYQLELLNRIFTGDLSPRRGEAENFDTYLTYLKQRFTQCIKHYKVYFKESSGNYTLHNFTEYTCHQLSGLPQPEESLTDDDPQILSLLIKQALHSIPVAEHDIIKALVRRVKNELQLDITAQVDFAGLKPEEIRFHYYQTLVMDEVARIIKTLTFESFQLHSQKQIKLYIQNHQLALEKLAQTLVEKLDLQDQQQLFYISGTYTLADIYKTFFIQLERIQQHIETHFTRYLDIDGLVPYQTRLLSSIDISHKLKWIYPRLLETDIDSQLLKIIDKPLQKLARIAQDDKITYKGLLYHKTLLQELFICLQEDTSGLNKEKVVEILYRLNYNSIDFFHYITSVIEKAVAEKETQAEQIKQLYHFQKIYRQLPVKTNSVYQHSLMPLPVQVLTWLKEEIYFLEKTAPQNVPPETKKTVQIPGSEMNKITTRLSVAQLAYFLRVMYEIGLISVKSQWDIFRFLQENFSSKKKEIISTQSLNNKYYNVEDSTKQAIKDVLIQMLNYINKSK